MPREATGVAEAKMRFTYDGQKCENVYHVFYEGGWTESNMLTLGEAMKEWWVDTLQIVMPTTLQLDEITIEDLSPGSDAGVVYNAGLPIAGSNVNPQLPNHVTVALKKNTGMTGRHRRGRLYHLGIKEPDVTGNTVGASFVNGLLTAYNGLIAVIQALDMVWVLVSFFYQKSPRETALITPISSISCETTVDSQRRRLPGRGS